MKNRNTKTAKQIIPASRMLQSIVGTGTIKSEHITKAQGVIDRVKGRLDISEFSRAHLSEISEALNDIKLGNVGDDEIIEKCTHSIVNFKSAVGLFGDGRVLPLCSVFFQFVESIKAVDDDFYDVVGIYLSVMTKIIIDDAFNEDEIQMVTTEIKLTCDRYYERHPEVTPIKIIDNVGLTFTGSEDVKGE